MRLLVLAVAAAACLAPVAAMAQEAAAGEQAFRRCTACHSVGEGASNRMGPHLNGVVGKPAATQEGFNYSRAMIEAGQGGLVWTPETLAPFIKSPRQFLPGTKMNFAGIPDDQAIADIVAYLLTFSPDYVPAAPASEGAPQ